jgi:hypothetical protein
VTYDPTADLAKLKLRMASDYAAQTGMVASIQAQLAAPPPPPPPPPPPSSSSLLGRTGLFPGFGNVKGFTGFQTWLGQNLSHVVQMADTTSGGNAESSVWGELSVASLTNVDALASGRTLVLSVPLAFGPQNPSTAQAAANLSATIAGANDAHYRAIAIYVVAAKFAGVIIRLGWEFDGDWMPWSSVGNELLFMQAFAHVAALFRSVLLTCKIDCCGTLGFHDQYAKACPAGVDIYGLDVYDGGADVAAGIATHQAFATSKGKPYSFPEWGLTSSDNPGFVQKVLAAAADPRCAYNAYFNENTNGAHVLWNFPNAQAQYKALVH